jgi:hypothetical protein
MPEGTPNINTEGTLTPNTSKWTPADWALYQNLIQQGQTKTKAALNVAKSWSWKKHALVWGTASTIAYLGINGKLPEAHNSVINNIPKVFRSGKNVVGSVDTTIGKTFDGIGNCLERFSDWREGTNNPEKPCTTGYVSGDKKERKLINTTGKNIYEIVDIHRKYKVTAPGSSEGVVFTLTNKKITKGNGYWAEATGEIAGQPVTKWLYIGQGGTLLGFAHDESKIK